MVAKKKDTPLGSLVTTYHAQPLTWRHLSLIFLPLCVGILGLVGVGYWRALYGYTNYGPVAARSWGQPWFLAATWLTLPLLLYALRRIHRAKFRVDVHTHGLSIHRPPGKKTDFLWEEISGLTFTVTEGSFLGWRSAPRHHLVLHPAQGKAVHLDSRIKHLSELTTLLKKQIYPRLLPAYRDTFRQGNPLNFGTLAISKNHLTYQETKVPWTYLEGITAKDGNLIIQLSPHKQLKVPAKQIQNMELLVKFIKEEVRT